MNDAWCEPDDCPASICNGPHVSHACVNGDTVTARADNTTPCPFCGATSQPAPGRRHMAWCKERALEYLDRGDIAGAITSFSSDIAKDETTNTPGTAFLIATVGMPLVLARDVAELRRFFEGFAS